MPGDQPQSLSTDRLLLRQWQPSDAEPFARLNADSAVMEHFVAPLDRAASDAMAERCRAAIERDGWGLWAAEVGATGEFIGFIGLAKPNFDAPFMPAVEIGWRLARSAWGKGYATEGATAAAAFGFDVAGLSEIVSLTATRNRRSRAVMERLGMTHDPRDDFDHPRIPEGHRLRHHVLYRLRRGAG